jgi:hypothetical protein
MGVTRWVPMTLRITVSECPESTTMKLEGKLVGPWVAELDRVWRSLVASLGTRKFRVDLCGVDQVDPSGKKVLAEIYGSTGADFLANTPITDYYAEQARAMLQNPRDSREAD